MAHDQAAGLRRMMGQPQGARALGLFGTQAVPTALVCACLAQALSARGSDVWILDEAPAPLDVAAQFGRLAPVSLEEVLNRGEPVLNALTELIPGVHCLPLSTGNVRPDMLAGERWHRVIESLKVWTEPPQFLLIHPARGDATESLALGAAERLLVLTLGRVERTRAYALLKQLHRVQPAARWWVVILGHADGRGAQETFAALEATARRFLGVALQWLGAVPLDEGFMALRRGVSSVQALPRDRPVTRAFRQLAEALAAAPACADAYPHEAFWLKMWALGRMIDGGARLGPSLRPLHPPPMNPSVKRA
ncbi:MAG: hypothetical protein NZ524_00990 [Thiobacillaceae bacterium]|nr:hypothetical protein [Thiobacillaceae bacterium]MDW8323853.1 hypothetical protein [Burkholderiales bacterium]